MPAFSKAHLRSALVVVAFVLASAGAASLRTLLLGSEALAAAEAAFDQGELAESIREARRAAAMTVPGATHVDAAYARLQVIARGAEAAGKNEVAVSAWEATRGAALESRHPCGAPRPELARANENLARLRAQNTARRESPERTAALERELLRALERPTGASALATSLVALGFALAVLGTAWGAWRGISRDGRVFGRQLVFGATLVAIGLACWTFAVSLA